MASEWFEGKVKTIPTDTSRGSILADNGTIYFFTKDVYGNPEYIDKLQINRIVRFRVDTPNTTEAARVLKKHITVDYYTARVVAGKIEVSKINISIDSVNDRKNIFSTKEEAVEDIKKYIPQAKLIAENLISKFHNFCVINKCNISYCVDGDTYGVTDYQYVSFKINEYEFTYILE